MKYAIITGASRGIGLATAEKFLHEGYRVINISRSVCPLASVISLPADFSMPVDTATLTSGLEAAIGSDVSSITLIHNAAVSMRDTVSTVTQEGFESVMRTNVEAPRVLNRLVLPMMPCHAGSSILYVGSTLSYVGAQSSFSYTVSKHAILGMMRASAKDLAPQGIHSACICPSFTDTEMLSALFPGQQMNDLVSSFGALITPAAIAKALFFAASMPECNGVLLPVDKGA
jgi:NAD(P)-dependent dehydrogenase (short-subunit alcohol dehydrogenase family)